MLRRSLVTMALLALFTWTAQAQASDPFPLSNQVDGDTFRLDGTDAGEDTDLVHFYRRACYGGGYYGGGFYGGGYRGFYGGYGYYRPYYRSYYYGGYYPRYYGYSYNYYPRYYGGYYGGYGYGGYGGGYGYAGYGYGGYGYGGYGGFCGVSGAVDDLVATITCDLPCVPCLPSCVVQGGITGQIVTPQLPQGGTPNAPPNPNPAPGANPNPNAPPEMPKVPENGGNTYPYNGGPNNPIPQPQNAQPGPATQQPQPTVPIKGYLVSLPGERESLNLSYQPFGAQPQAAAPASAPTSGFAYRAYGEQPAGSGFATRR